MIDPLTVNCDVDGNAPLPCRRLTPVDGGVRLLDCFYEAASGCVIPPVFTVGQALACGSGPLDGPSM